jgi:hypothetical protein
MGRKRLMTILAGVIAAVGLQVGPAAALDLGVGSIKLDTSDGLQVEAEADAEVGDLTLDPKVSADVSSDPKVEAEAGDTKVDSREVTDPVKDAVDGGSSPSEPSPSPSEPSNGGSGGSTGGDSSDGGSSSTSDRSSGSTGPSDDRQVTTAGRTESFISPERAAQIEAFRAMRDADASFGGGEYDGRVVPGVQLAPRTAPTDDAFADSEVAPGVELAAPSVAGERPQQAQLATTPFSGTLPEVPVALQLLAGTLVAGTTLAWHLARRELGTSPILRRSGR